MKKSLLLLIEIIILISKAPLGKGYNTRHLSKDMKQTFDYNGMISELEKHYHCPNIQNELDKIMGNLENVEINKDNKKLYKYVATKLCECSKKQAKSVSKSRLNPPPKKI